MFDGLWQSGLDFILAHFYISPFWYWCFLGALVVAFFTALGWYFSFMRPIAGIVFVAIASALFGYREGETDAERHAKAEKDREAAAAKRRDTTGW